MSAGNFHCGTYQCEARMKFSENQFVIQKLVRNINIQLMKFHVRSEREILRGSSYTKCIGKYYIIYLADTYAMKEYQDQ
jgi:hypothetical protein